MKKHGNPGGLSAGPTRFGGRSTVKPPAWTNPHDPNNHFKKGAALGKTIGDDPALLDRPIVVEVDRHDLYTEDVSIRGSIDNLAKTANIPAGKRAEFARAIGGVVARFKKKKPSIFRASQKLPAEAPELFKDREDRSEDIVAFLKRVWAPWVFHGTISRSDLRARDVSAIRGIENWIAKERKPLPRELNIPTKSQVNDRQLAEDPMQALHDPRLLSAQARRLRRRPNSLNKA